MINLIDSKLTQSVFRLIVIITFLFAGSLRISAQAPLGINYQAIARTPDGLPVAEETVAVIFNVHTGSASGAVEYAERHNVETNKFGLFTLEIGRGTVLSGTFANIDWASGNKFLEVEINGSLNGTTEMLSVPYALYAANTLEKQTLTLSGNKLSITGGNEVTLPGGTGGATSVSELNDVDISGLQTGQVLKWNGSKWEPADDNSLPGLASGDVTGAYNALKVEGIQNRPIDPTAPTPGQVLQWDGQKWKPATVSGGNAGTLDDLTDVSAPAPANGQYLQWNAVAGAWQPATPTGGISYTPGAGISINGSNQISNSGDLSNTNEIQTLSFNPGTNTLSLSLGGGNVTIPSSTNLTLDGLTDVNAPAPASGQVLQWDGTAWKPVTLSSGTALTAGSGIQINGNVVSATDNSATNEIQVLSLANGNELTLTNGGGTVTLPTGIYTGGAGIQVAGNQVTNTGDTNSADDLLLGSVASGDLSGTYPGPTVSRLQGRNISTTAPSNGQILKFNSGLNQWEPANEQGGGGNSQWINDGTGIHYSSGTVKVHNTGELKLTEMANAQALVPVQFQSSYSQNAGAIATYGENGSVNTMMTHIIDGMTGTGYPNFGALGIFGSDGFKATPPFFAYANPLDNTGSFYLTNALNIVTAQMGAFNNSGFMVLNNSSNKGILTAGPNLNGDGSGTLALFNNNNQANVQLGHLDNYINNGFVGVYSNASGSQFPYGSLYVDQNSSGRMVVTNNTGGFAEAGVSNGQGYFATNGTKNFRITDPRDTTKEIWYASVEGPEAGAYDRGTATLKNGEIFVLYSDHFAEVINSNTVTVQLTPLSAETDGLAVIEKTASGFKVKELRGGQGNFSFDWEVKAVRKGFERFEVVRDRQYSAGMKPLPAEAFQKQLPGLAPPGH